MSKELTSYEQARQKLNGGSKKKPVLIIYYAEWCGHCQNRQAMWKKFAAKYGKQIKTYKLESKHLGGQSDITGFPTYQINKGNGIETMGAQEEEDPQKMKQQVLGGGGGGRRGSTRRMRGRRRARGKRTFRNNMSFT